MKKCIKGLGLIMIAMSLMLSITAFAANDITVKINGEPLSFDVPPQLIKDRTMVPLRAIFEALGAQVDWNGATRTVTATRGDTVVVSTIGSRAMYINGTARTMDVEPVIVNDRTLVPARFVAEAFDCDVEWDGGSRTVDIYTEGNTFTVDEDDVPDDTGGFVDDDEEIALPSDMYDD